MADTAKATQIRLIAVFLKLRVMYISIWKNMQSRKSTVSQCHDVISLILTHASNLYLISLRGISICAIDPLFTQA